MARAFDIFRQKPSAPPPPPKRSKNQFGPFLLALAIIGAIVIIFGKFSPAKTPSTPISPTISAYPTTSFQIKTPTPTPTPVSSPTPENTPTPTAEPTKTVELSIRVLNGSGTSGKAQEVKDILEKSGYPIREVGNAKYRYNTTDIYYKPDKKSDAEKIVTILKDYKTTLTPSTTIVGKDDILVVVGIK